MNLLACIFLISSAFLIKLGAATTSWNASSKALETEEMEFRLGVTVTIVWVACVALYFLREYKIPISGGATIMTLGLIYRAIFLHSKYGDKACPVNFTIDDFFAIYLPIMYFKISFCADSYALAKAFFQGVVIAIPLGYINAFAVGQVVNVMLGDRWSNEILYGFGMLSVTTFPSEIIDLLMSLGVNTKQEQAILQTEHLMMISRTVGHFQSTYGMKQTYGAKEASDNIFQPRYLLSMALVLLRQLLMAFLTGAIFGFAGNMSMKLLSNVKSLVLITLSWTYISYYVSNTALRALGVLTVTVVGKMMSQGRVCLPKEVDDALENIWEFLYRLVSSFGYSIIAINHLSQLVYEEMEPKDFVLIFITYVISNVCRFVAYLIFYPIIKRLGHGMTHGSLIVIAWCGLRSPIILYMRRKEQQEETTMDDKFAIHQVALFYLMHLINGSTAFFLFKYMGYTKISKFKVININNCFQHVYANRNQVIGILKKDKFLADSNWTVVTQKTTLRNTYQSEFDSYGIRDKNNVVEVGYRMVFCSECKREVRVEPTNQDLLEIRRECKVHILRALKIAFSKQYETGLLSIRCLRKLVMVFDNAMDSQEPEVKMELVFKDYLEESIFTNSKARRFLDKVFKPPDYSVYRVPRRTLRRYCHKLVLNQLFPITMYILVVLDTVIAIYRAIVTTPLVRENMHDFTAIIACIMAPIYVLECSAKILSFSFIYFWRHGMKTYFSSIWRVLEFLLVLVAIPDFFISAVYCSTGIWMDVYQKFVIARTLRGLRLLQINIVLYNVYQILANYMDNRRAVDLALFYEIGLASIAAIEEVCELLPQMIRRDDIRDEVHNKLQANKLFAMKHLGVVRYKLPKLSITIKTHLAIKTVLNEMSEAIEKLRKAGWIEAKEFWRLQVAIIQTKKYVSYHISEVDPPTMETLIREQVWLLHEDEIVIEYIYRNMRLKTYKAGDVMTCLGPVNHYILCLVEGYAKMSYEPTSESMMLLDDFGVIPSIDFITIKKLKESYIDFIAVGNCWGRRSCLTNGSFGATTIAESDCTVLMLHKSYLERAMQMSPHPIFGLESKMWRSITINLVISVLSRTPYYQDDMENKIKYVWERGFTPSLKNQAFLEVTEMIQDIILVEGMAIDNHTKNLFTAPHYIPRNVKHLILPDSPLFRIPIRTQTRLFIVPEVSAKETDILQTRESHFYDDYDSRTTYGGFERLRRKSLYQPVFQQKLETGSVMRRNVVDSDETYRTSAESNALSLNATLNRDSQDTYETVDTFSINSGLIRELKTAIQSVNLDGVTSDDSVSSGKSEQPPENPPNS